MNEKELAGRRLFVWRGIDPDDDTARLTEKIAEAAITKLFNVEGSLVLFSQGQTLPVTRQVLSEIIAKLVAGVRLVAEPAPAQAGDTLKAEYFAFDFPIGGDLHKGPNDRTLASITTALLPLVAKGPSTPHRLSEQQQREIKDRVRIGEPKGKLAAEYGVDIAAIRQLAVGQ